MCDGAATRDHKINAALQKLEGRIAFKHSPRFKPWGHDATRLLVMVLTIARAITR